MIPQLRGGSIHAGVARIRALGMTDGPPFHRQPLGEPLRVDHHQTVALALDEPFGAQAAEDERDAFASGTDELS